MGGAGEAGGRVRLVSGERKTKLNKTKTTKKRSEKRKKVSPAAGRAAPEVRSVPRSDDTSICAAKADASASMGLLRDGGR